MLHHEIKQTEELEYTNYIFNFEKQIIYRFYVKVKSNLPNNKLGICVIKRNPTEAAISKKVEINPIIASLILSIRLIIPRVKRDPII